MDTDPKDEKRRARLEDASNIHGQICNIYRCLQMCFCKEYTCICQYMMYNDLHV